MIKGKKRESLYEAGWHVTESVFTSNGMMRRRTEEKGRKNQITIPIE